MNSQTRSSPRKFAEKIALLNKKEAEATAEFDRIIKEVEITKSSTQPNSGLPQRSSSFSNWETCSQTGQQQQAHQQYHQTNFLAQPMQFPQAQLNQLQEQRQHVINTTRHHHHHHQQQQHQLPYLDQQQQQQPLIYVNRRDSQQQQQQNNYMNTSPSLTHGPIQPISIEVPNIEIFPIDDEYQQQQNHHHLHDQQQQPSPATATHGILTNVHYRNDCSNPPPISSARSMPNIASLSVSPSSSGHMMAQTVVASQHSKPLASAGQLDTGQPTSTISRETHEKYAYSNSLGTGYYNQHDDFCSLPVQEPMSGLDRNDPNTQSQTHIPRSDSWQQVSQSNSPISGTPTPPLGQRAQHQHQRSTPNQRSPTSVQFVAGQHSPQGNVVRREVNGRPAVHSPPDMSPHRQQVQTLHQDHHYYPQQQGQMIRANSANVINKYPNNNNLLEAPRINNNLSKSIDAGYGYMNGHVLAGDFDQQMSQQPAVTVGGGNEVGGQGGYVVNDSGIQYMASSFARSCNQNNIENIQSERKLGHQYADTSQQQMLASSQYTFFQ